VTGRTVKGVEPLRLLDEGNIMADKSPRQHLSKKSGKTLKEKRAAKHAKAESKGRTEIIPPTRKR
jgi:hypothetical protein